MRTPKEACEPDRHQHPTDPNVRFGVNLEGSRTHAEIAESLRELDKVAPTPMDKLALMVRGKRERERDAVKAENARLRAALEPFTLLNPASPRARKAWPDMVQKGREALAEKGVQP